MFSIDCSPTILIIKSRENWVLSAHVNRKDGSGENYIAEPGSTSHRALYEHTESEGTGVFINIFTAPNHMDVFLNV